MAAKQGGKSASQVPISKHPAFPAIVALWFAALLGIGSLVLPVNLFEATIRTTGLASVLPAVEPPLGVSARILIALVAAALGVVAGLLIARKVAAAQRQAHAPNRAFALREDTPAAKRPISAHEELWSEGFDEPVEAAPTAPIAGRRRALSVTDESGPSELLDSAPLPDDETEIVLVQTPPTLEPTDAPIAEPAEDDALELSTFAESEAIETDFDYQKHLTLELAANAHDEGDHRCAAQTVPEPVAPEPAISLDAARPFDAPLDAPAPVAASSPAEQLRREFPVEQVPAFAAPFAARLESETEPHESALQDAEGASVDAADEEDGAKEPVLSELSIADLVERFTLSLQRAAERAEAEAEVQAHPQASAAEAELPPRYVPDLGVEAVEAPRFAPLPEPAEARPAEAPQVSPEEPTEERAPEPFGEPATAIPAALRPVAFGMDEAVEDEEEIDELSLTLSLAPESRPFDRPAAPFPAAAAPPVEAAPDPCDDIEEARDVLAERDYSSLLNMRKQAASREFVRIEDETPSGDAPTEEAIEPVVVFPGQEQRRAVPAADRSADAGMPRTPSTERPFAAPASVRGTASDPMQTERALREALHKLQRLSGAA